MEKSPPDLIRMRFLAAVFPPASFVVIARHPLSVCRRVPYFLQLVCTWNWLNGYEWALADERAANLSVFWTYYEACAPLSRTKPVPCHSLSPVRTTAAGARGAARRARAQEWTARPVEETEAMMPVLGLPRRAHVLTRVYQRQQPPSGDAAPLGGAASRSTGRR